MSAVASGERARARGLLLLAGVFVLAFALRAAAVAQYERAHPHAERPVIDEQAYDAWAREIAAGDWVGDEVFFQEPLYPYAVAVVYAVLGPERSAVRYLQCALGALACVLVSLLARRLFGATAGAVAGLALALHRPAVWLPALLLKENLFLALLPALALALIAARGARCWLGVGVLAGLGALLRGNLLVLLPAIALWPLAPCLARGGERRPLRTGLLLAAASLAGMALVLAPVALRNQAVGGELVLATSGAGTNLYGGNNPDNPYGRATEFDWVRGIPEHEAGDWRREAERRLGRDLAPSEVSAYWRDQVLLSLRTDPWLHARILWNKLRLTLGSYEVPDNHLLAWDARYVALLRWPLPGFGITGALGLAGLALFAAQRLARRRLPSALAPADPGAAWQLACLAALYLATVVLTVTSSRIRLPLVALLAPFAGFFGAWVLAATRLARGRAAALAAAGACLALAALVAWTPVFTPAERALDLEKRDFNLAVQLIEEGRDVEARALVEDLLARHPSSARLATVEAQLDWRAALALDRSDPTAARALAQHAAESLVETLRRPGLFPRERFRAQALLGWIRLGQRDARGAILALRTAREFDDEDLDIALALAQALELAAPELEPDARLATLHEARDILLHPSKLSPEAAERLAVALSRAEAALGRELLQHPGANQAEARALITTALARLEPLAQSSSDDVRRRARTAAGWIQLHLHNAPAAERHFRAALAHDPSDHEARLGLVQALLTSIEQAPENPETAPRRAEARMILDGLAALSPDDPAVIDLRQRLER